jgi:hypothetical protein
MAGQARRGPGLEDWRERYRDMLATPEVAAGAIRSGDNLFIPNAYLGVMPPHIVARKAELRDVTVEICTPLSRYHRQNLPAHCQGGP